MLVFNGWFPPEAATKFPRTMELLRHPAFEAGAFFVLHPLSVVGPHAHSRLGGDKLTLHLGIDVEPERNFIHVDGRFLEEREGEVLIFDGSHEHFALNAGVRDRAILYCEFDRSKL
jgi:beta-hydroxylase